jgi:hypothetical protein
METDANSKLDQNLETLVKALEFDIQVLDF